MRMENARENSTASPELEIRYIIYGPGEARRAAVWERTVRRRIDGLVV